MANEPRHALGSRRPDLIGTDSEAPGLILGEPGSTSGVDTQLAGSVTPSDLPPAMQSSKTLSMIERVELEAIRKALQEAKGNRVKAADILGISRATVYRKMKAYRISGE
jgi:DNA-binding NtrC family response regulator